MTLFSSSPILDVVPLLSSIDQDLSISVFHLSPGEKIILRAETQSADGKKWVSWAQYRADPCGKVNLFSDAPLAGSYTDVDSMGLFWSMEPEDQSIIAYKMPPDEMRIRLSLEIDEKMIAEKEIHRFYGNREIQRITIEESGIKALLFLPPSSSPLPAIMTLNGGAAISEERAQFLALHGYAALALAYFGSEGVPDRLQNIPLEYFVKAIDLLKQRPEVDPDRIGLLGISRGGEAALLLGAYFPEKMQAIATHVASSVIYPSQGTHISPWSLKNQPVLPLAPILSREEISSDLGSHPENAISLSPYFLDFMKKFEVEYEKSKIPVEKITCPLLVIGSKEDQMWPSALFAEQIDERLTDFGCSNGKIILYEGAGHRLALPHTPVARTITFHPEIGKWFDFGGEGPDNAFAGKDAWKETLLFFEEMLKKEK